MDGWLALKAVTVGVAVAAPVGPMSLLCLQRTLQRGRTQGLAFGMGIACGDSAYAGLGALGITALSSALLANGNGLRIAGALVLIYFAVRIMLTRPDRKARTNSGGTMWRGFASAFLLTLANPPTMLFFAGIFASIAPLTGAAQAAVFAAGVLAGSALWWVVLTAAVAGTASKISSAVLTWINRVSGLVLIGFAVYALSGMTR